MSLITVRASIGETKLSWVTSIGWCGLKNSGCPAGEIVSDVPRKKTCSSVKLIGTWPESGRMTTSLAALSAGSPATCSGCRLLSHHSDKEHVRKTGQIGIAVGKRPDFIELWRPRCIVHTVLAVLA